MKTGCDYDITVQLPENYSLSGKPYPTMYVLDAEQDDCFVAVNCNKISKELNTQNVIVIGIRYHNSNERDIDYTPTVTTYGKGGSFAFIKFIKEELIPKIQKEYNADTHRSKRVIIGHSFGGLFGAYAFTKHNEIFGNYLLLSPSLFYDNTVVLKYEQEERETIKLKSQLVFIGLGSSENGLLPANNLFYERLQKFYPQTQSVFVLVNGLGHMTSKNIGIVKALRYYFEHR